MDILFMDVETQESLYFQFVPQELDYKVGTSIAAISTFGRNNPRYHYTGSEDTVTFEIDWHSDVAEKNDVLKKCRWLESKTKTDAYQGELPQMLFKWGDVFNSDDMWIIADASYRISLFDKTASMRPKQAYQSITLKRITAENRTHNQIKKYPL